MRRLAALPLFVVLLAGCAGDTQEADPAGVAETSAETTDDAWTEDQCAEASMEEWTEHCSDAEMEDTSALDEGNQEPLELGAVAHTVGGQSYEDDTVTGGELDMTPTSVVYHKNDGAQWASVVVDIDNVGAVPAAATAPIDGLSWQLVLPDRTTRSSMDSSASDGTPNGWSCGGVIQAGLKQHCAESITLPDAVVPEGLQLMYLDGNGIQYRWDLPSTNTGPDADAYLAAMAS